MYVLTIINCVDFWYRCMLTPSFLDRPIYSLTLFNARQFYLSKESFWVGKAQLRTSAHLSSLLKNFPP